jgi:HSP20 family protein
MLARWIPQNNAVQRSTPLMPAVDTLFEDAFSVFKQPPFTERWMSVASADVVETADELQLAVDLPGHDPRNIQVQVEGDTLTIQAERKPQALPEGAAFLMHERAAGRVARSFVLPSSVDGSRCSARYEQGVLTLTLPRREEAKPRTIDVKVS